MALRRYCRNGNETFSELKMSEIESHPKPDVKAAITTTNSDGGGERTEFLLAAVIY